MLSQLDTVEATLGASNAVDRVREVLVNLSRLEGVLGPLNRGEREVVPGPLPSPTTSVPFQQPSLPLVLHFTAGLFSYLHPSANHSISPEFIYHLPVV